MALKEAWKSESSVVIALLLLFVAISALYVMGASPPRRRYLAVMSPSCSHCRRARSDIEQNDMSGAFAVVQPHEVQQDYALYSELASAGYTGAVPFFYNPDQRKSVVGYHPTSTLVAALG
jgi:hypothetical protein